MRDELCPYGCGIRLKIDLLEIGREALEAAGELLSLLYMLKHTLRWSVK